MELWLPRLKVYAAIHCHSDCVSFCGENRSGINVKLNWTRDAPSGAPGWQCQLAGPSRSSRRPLCRLEQ